MAHRKKHRKIDWTFLFRDDNGNLSKKAFFFTISMFEVLLITLASSILYFLGKIQDLSDIAVLLGVITGIISGTYVSGKLVDHK